MILTLFFIIKIGLIIGLEAFLDHILLPFLGLPFKIGFYIVAFTIYAFIYILLLLGPGGLGYYLYWLFHRRMERKLEKRRASLSQLNPPLRRERHTIFVIFGVMNGLLIPLVIGFIAIIDHKILSDWVKEDRLLPILLAIIGFISILVMILMRGKMMGVKLTLILITLTALSSMINNTPHHIVQALNIIISSYHDVKTTTLIVYCAFSMILWLGPGLILFWLHTLFQQPQLAMDPRAQHERAVIIKHVGIALYLGFSAAVLIYITIDSMRIMPYRDLGTVFSLLVIPIPIPIMSGLTLFSFTSMLYALAIMLTYRRSMQPSFLGRLMISLLPSLLLNAWAVLIYYGWGVDR